MLIFKLKNIKANNNVMVLKNKKKSKPLIIPLNFKTLLKYNEPVNIDIKPVRYKNIPLNFTEITSKKYKKLAKKVPTNKIEKLSIAGKQYFFIYSPQLNILNV